MRFERFAVRNYRSIRDLEIRDLPDVCVFYGENGSGKSNLLAALSLFWEGLRLFATHGFGSTPDAKQLGLSAADLPIGRRTGTISLEGRIDLGDRAFTTDGLHTRAFEAEIAVQLGPTGEGTVRLFRLVADTADKRGDRQSLTREPGQARFEEHARLDRHAAGLTFANWAEALRDALDTGVLHVPEIRGVPAPTGDGALSVPALAMAGRFEEAAFRALVSPDAEMLARLERLKAVMTAPPLSRPPFRPVQLESGQFGLQEVVPSGRTQVGIPVERAGLGVRQLYPILGSILLAGAPIVTLEEPEAHLHPMTSGRKLRDVLRGLVPGTVHQLFVATHSELFDLNPKEYFEVTNTPEGGTRVERRGDLVSLDERHTYSPGGARHAVFDALQRGEPDRVVAHRADGEGITASEMVALLIEDHPDAVEFLKNVTAAAVRLVAVRAANRP